MAPNIAVGDVHPQCDTYTRATVDLAEEHPVVATCKVTH
jgi:hypothetical protein